MKPIDFYLFVTIAIKRPNCTHRPIMVCVCACLLYQFWRPMVYTTSHTDTEAKSNQANANAWMVDISCCRVYMSSYKSSITSVCVYLHRIVIIENQSMLRLFVHLLLQSILLLTCLQSSIRFSMIHPPELVVLVNWLCKFGCSFASPVKHSQFDVCLDICVAN